MPKTYSSVWLHIVWSTKLRKPNLFRSFRYDLFNYLKSYGEKNEITVDVINGIEDHVHLLIRLKTTQKNFRGNKFIEGSLIKMDKSEREHGRNFQMAEWLWRFLSKRKRYTESQKLYLQSRRIS